MEGILTTAQRERVGRDVAIHAPATATGPELAEATARVVDRLESLAASAAVWELWKSGEVELSWDAERQEVAVHAAEPDEEDEGDPFGLGGQVTYAAPSD